MKKIQQLLCLEKTDLMERFPQFFRGRFFSRGTGSGGAEANGEGAPHHDREMDLTGFDDFAFEKFLAPPAPQPPSVDGGERMNSTATLPASTAWEKVDEPLTATSLISRYFAFQFDPYEEMEAARRIAWAKETGQAALGDMQEIALPVVGTLRKVVFL